MDVSSVSKNSIKILDFLKGTDLKPDEKIAALDVASATIRAALSAETLKIMCANILGGRPT
jgi:hypothetical protein